MIVFLQAALAAPTITLTATLRADLQTITGALRMDNGEGVRLVDALSLLPMPQSDTVALRTWPRSAEQGWVEMDPREDGSMDFYAILPRRYGASGLVPGRGVFLNGLWHPQPVRGGELEDVEWNVTLQLPEGTVGTLNGVYGTGILHYRGTAERLAISAIPGGEIRSLPLEAGELVVVDSRPRPRLDARLAALLESSWPGPMAPDALVVITPSRRRLSRPGPDVLYLSDRAFRATGGLWRYHTSAVRLGLLSAALPLQESWQRHLVAAAISERLDVAPTPEELLGWFSWIPQIDDLLYDGQMPFFAEIFNETWPGDPLADDLQEIIDRRIPARALLDRIDALYGEDSTLRLARGLLAGQSLHAATIAAGVPPVSLRDWMGWSEPSELSVAVDEQADGSWRVTVTRVAEDSAPFEPVLLVIDGVEHPLMLGPGAAQESIAVAYRPSSVQLDPDHQLLQVDRSDDRWPERWTTVVSFFPYELSVSQRQLSAYANIGLRRQFNTRWRYNLGFYTDQENRAGASVSAVRYLGPLIDRRYRVMRVWGGVGGALLNPDYRPLTGGPVVVEGFLGVARDTRERLALPRSGYRLSAGSSAGLALGGGEQWVSGNISALGLAPLGGRVVMVGRVKGGAASGELEHRLLSLGGSSGVQGLPAGAVVGGRRLVGSTELRWLALNNAAVPIPLAWVSHMQVSGGLDLGITTGNEGRSSAAGWSAGLAFLAEVVGADPNFGGVWLAGPLWTEGEADTTEGLQLYVRISQPF